MDVAIVTFNLFEISIVSVGLKDIPKKLLFLYRNPNYFCAGAIATSILANMHAFPLHNLLFSAKAYINSHWLQNFILPFGVPICIVTSLTFLVIAFYTGLVGAARSTSSYNENYILNILWNMISPAPDNPNLYRFITGAETYIYYVCFFSNILIISTPSIYLFFNLFEPNSFLSIFSIVSTGIGFTFSIASLFLPSVKRVKSHFELQINN